MERLPMWWLLHGTELARASLLGGSLRPLSLLRDGAGGDERLCWRYNVY